MPHTPPDAAPSAAPPDEVKRPRQAWTYWDRWLTDLLNTPLLGDLEEESTGSQAHDQDAARSDDAWESPCP
jgi:hypothetical protein